MQASVAARPRLASASLGWQPANPGLIVEFWAGGPTNDRIVVLAEPRRVANWAVGPFFDESARERGLAAHEAL